MDVRIENSAQRNKLKEWPTRRIAFLVLSSGHLTILAGPLDVFARASALLDGNGKRRSPAYAVELLTADENPLITGSGLGLIGGRRWTEAHDPIDTLLIVASPNLAHSRIDPELLAWTRTSAEHVRRIGSVCAGAFVLAAAGILDGRQATTHWELADILAQRYPHISVDGDRIFTQDGNVWTSAGVSAGIDLALAMGQAGEMCVYPGEGKQIATSSPENSRHPILRLPYQCSFSDPGPTGACIFHFPKLGYFVVVVLPLACLGAYFLHVNIAKRNNRS